MNNLLHKIALLRQQAVRASRPPAFVLPDETTTLFFGDSVFLRVSKKDVNTETLKEMLIRHYAGSRIFVFAHSALSLSHYFMYLSCVRNSLDKVHQIIIPINYRAFSLQWECNPVWQYRDALLEMVERCGNDSLTINDLVTSQDHNLSVATYFKYGTQSSDFFLKSIKSKVLGADDFIERRRRIFAYNYLFDDCVIRNSKRFYAFDMLIKQFSDASHKFKFFIPPINYQAIEFLFGKQAVNYLERNIGLVIDYGRSLGSDVHDFSMVADRFCFFNEFEATEHLNESGRNVLLRKIAGVVGQ